MSQKLFVDKVTVMLRHYREASGMSQSELADALKIGLRSYQRYESGDSVPSIDLVYLLSRVLNFDLRELFSPHDLKAHIPNVRFYEKENEKMFLTDSYVVESKILEIFNSNEFSKILDTGETKLIKNFDKFVNSPFPLALSTPKQTIINHTGQKQIGISHDVMSTVGPHNDARVMGLIWANCMDHKICFYDHEIKPRFPKGEMKLIVRGIFSGHHNHYMVLSVAEFFPKKA